MHLRNHRLRRRHHDEDQFTNSTEIEFPLTSASTQKTWSPVDAKSLVLWEECIPDYKEHYCTRGQCFMIRTLPENGGKLIGPVCECYPGWKGYRCEYMDIPQVSQGSSDDTAKLIARTLGLTFAGIILCAILVVLGVFYYRRKKKSIDGPQDLGLVTQVFQDLRQRFSSKRLERNGSCKSVDSGDWEQKSNSGILSTVCQQKSPVRWQNRTFTTVAAAPWVQVAVGSPVPKTVPHSCIVHWTPRRLSTIGYESISLGETMV